jgi:hypothetical protein
MLRQRETLLWVFLMPLLFFYFIGTVTGGFGSGSGERPDPLALQTAAQQGPILDEIIRRLEQQHYRVDRPVARAELDTYRRRLSIPVFTEESVRSRTPVTVTFELKDGGLGADFDQLRVSRAVYTVVADLAVLQASDQPVTAEAFKALASAPRPLTLTVTSAGRRRDPPSGFSQAVPGTMVMFTMLILLTSGAILLVVERQAGLLRRLASTPITPGSIVLGKWISRMALGLVQLAFAMIVGRLVFGVDWGSSLPMVILVLAHVGRVHRLARAAPGECRAHDGPDGRHRCADEHGAGGAWRLLVADRDHAEVDAVALACPADRVDDGCDAQAGEFRIRLDRRATACRRTRSGDCHLRVGRREDLPLSIEKADPKVGLSCELFVGSRQLRSTPWLEPANSFLPDAARTTVRALPVGEPSLAMLPSTVTTSPTFSVSRRQPLRMRMFGLPISMPQFVTLPVFSSATSR